MLRSGLAVLVILGCVSSAGIAQDRDTFPAEQWPVISDPGAIGWSVEKLREMEAYMETIDTSALMIVHRGVVVGQWGRVTRPYMCESMRKSILSALFGIYVDKGDIELDATLAGLGIDDTEPSLTETEKQATVRDLLMARSGVYHPAAYEPDSMEDSRPERGSHAPGTHWFYNNWDFNTLATIFEQQAGLSVFEAFEKHFVSALNLQDYDAKHTRYWREEEKSLHPAYLFSLSARDLARFGLLMCRQGVWNGNQIVPSQWVEESTQPHTEKTWRESSYGYMWWVAQPDDNVLLGVETEPGAFAATGSGGHRLIILPESDIVVAHRVNTTFPGPEVGHGEFAKLLTMILEAAPEP